MELLVCHTCGSILFTFKNGFTLGFFFLHCRLISWNESVSLYALSCLWCGHILCAFEDNLFMEVNCARIHVYECLCISIVL